MTTKKINGISEGVFHLLEMFNVINVFRITPIAEEEEEEGKSFIRRKHS